MIKAGDRVVVTGTHAHGLVVEVGETELLVQSERGETMRFAPNELTRLATLTFPKRDPRYYFVMADDILVGVLRHLPVKDRYSSHARWGYFGANGQEHQFASLDQARESLAKYPPKVPASAGMVCPYDLAKFQLLNAGSAALLASISAEAETLTKLPVGIDRLAQWLYHYDVKVTRPIHDLAVAFVAHVQLAVSGGWATSHGEGTAVSRYQSAAPGVVDF